MPERGFKFLVCPNCAKRGVWMHLGISDDSWKCRYCDWYAFGDGNDRIDIAERKSLAEVNPGTDIWISDADYQAELDEESP